MSGGGENTNKSMDLYFTQINETKQMEIEEILIHSDVSFLIANVLNCEVEKLNTKSHRSCIVLAHERS